MRWIRQAAQTCHARDKERGLGPAMWGSLCAWAEMCLKGGSFLPVGVHNICTAPHSSPPTWPLAPPSWDHHLLCTWDSHHLQTGANLPSSLTSDSTHTAPQRHIHIQTRHTSTHMYTCAQTYMHTHTPLHIQTAATPPGCPSSCPHRCPEAFCPRFPSFCLWSAPTLSLGLSSPLPLPS